MRIAFVVGCVALAALAAVAWAAKDDLTLVSRVSGANGAPANAASYYPSVSGDGRYIAFTSAANNLSGEDTDAIYDVFVRDGQTNVLTLASRATGAAGAGGTDNSTDTSLSADGRYAAFTSSADNLSAEDNNLYGNVFVRDLQANTTTLVSRATGAAGTGANDTAYDADISADGRYVVFISNADNLSAEDNNNYINVFVRDLQANTTTLVSRAAGATGTGADDSSYNPSIATGGRYVAFQTNADNLSTEDNNTYTNVLVRDLQANTVTLVTRASGAAGAAANAGGYTPSISDNGRRVSFTSDADNLSPDDDNAYQGIFVRDLTANTTTLASRAGGANGAGANAASDDSHISGDGRRVTFVTGANNLSGEDNNAYDNIFIRDLATATLTYASRAAGARGVAADDHSEAPALSATGRYVAFSSTANDLSDDDDNAYYNVFLRDLGPNPSSGGGGGDGDTTKPRVSRVRMSRKRFRVGRKRTPVSAAAKAGTRFRYSLSERATVRITIQRALRGRGGRTRYRRAGKLTRTGEGPGRDSTAFSGRIGRRALKPGRYRATLRATDAAGNRSSAKRIGFRIVQR